MTKAAMLFPLSSSYKKKKKKKSQLTGFCSWTWVFSVKKKNWNIGSSYPSRSVFQFPKIKMLSSECFENPPSASKSTACGCGSIQEVGGLTTYVTGTGPPPSKLAILLISDIYGMVTTTPFFFFQNHHFLDFNSTDILDLIGLFCCNFFFAGFEAPNLRYV